MVKSVFVLMNLRQNGTELHLQTTYYHKLAHAVADAFFFEVDACAWQLFERLVNAACTLFQHLHFLIAKRHVMKHYEQMVFVSSAHIEVYHIHDAVRLLQQVQCSLILFSLNKLVS